MPDGENKPLSAQPTTPELAHYLFGNPWDRKDNGIIGRLNEEIHQLRVSVRNVMRMAWAILLIMLTATLALVVDVLSRDHVIGGS